jgi:hypothetical protein
MPPAGIAVTMSPKVTKKMLGDFAAD